jgi:hypothetical protein
MKEGKGKPIYKPHLKGKTSKPLSKQILTLMGGNEVDKFAPTEMAAA